MIQGLAFLYSYIRENTGTFPGRVYRQAYNASPTTLIMARQEHIHIIAAGGDIFPAYAATLRDRPDISHTFVFADIDLYSNLAHEEPAAKAQKEAARDAVTRVKALAASLEIPASLIYVAPPADSSTRDALLKIRKEHPDAHFSFDLTAGSKDMGLALFTLSLWLGGKVHYTYDGRKGDGVHVKLPVPKIAPGSVAANPNYLKILSTLARTPGKTDTEPGMRVLPRSYLFNQLAGFYVPVRKTGVRVAENRTGKTDPITGKRAVLHELSQGTFSNILTTMIAADLIEEVTGPEENRKEKFYRITAAGELALRLAELQPRKP